MLKQERQWRESRTLVSGNAEAGETMEVLQDNGGKVELLYQAMLKQEGQWRESRTLVSGNAEAGETMEGK